jgi:hypothetical protein
VDVDDSTKVEDVDDFVEEAIDQKNFITEIN